MIPGTSGQKASTLIILTSLIASFGRKSKYIQETWKHKNAKNLLNCLEMIDPKEIELYYLEDFPYGLACSKCRFNNLAMFTESSILSGFT